MSVTDQDVLTWVEQIAGAVSGYYGVEMLTARVLGWMMICDPPQQSAQQIAGTLGVSTASVMGCLRFLIAAGFLRTDAPLDDADNGAVRYRMENDAWIRVVRRRLAAFVAVRDIAQDGIQMIGPADPRSERMRAARDSFDWLDAVVTDGAQLQPSTGHSAPAAGARTPAEPAAPPGRGAAARPHPA